MQPGHWGIGVSGQSPLALVRNFSADSSMGTVPIAISAEKFLTTPRIQGAVIVRSIQQDSGELDPLQYGILAARGGVLSNSHACSRLNSG